MKYLVAAFALLATPALAQEELVWLGSDFETGASLGFGLPESDYMPLSFACEAGSGIVSVSFSHEPVGATDGVGVAIILQAGDIEIPVATTGTRLEMDDSFVLEGSTAFDARFADLITSAGTLHVFVGDGAEEYDLAGAREAARPLLERCPSA